MTLVGYIIVSIILLAPFDMYAWDETKGQYVNYKYDISQRLLLLLLLLFPLILGVYSVNCFVVGQCHLLSWVVALITLVWAGAVVITAFATKAFNLDSVMV